MQNYIGIQSSNISAVEELDGGIMLPVGEATADEDVDPPADPAGNLHTVLHVEKKNVTLKINKQIKCVILTIETC